jgi:hypothetical protein
MPVAIRALCGAARESGKFALIHEVASDGE